MKLSEMSSEVEDLVRWRLRVQSAGNGAKPDCSGQGREETGNPLEEF